VLHENKAACLCSYESAQPLSLTCLIFPAQKISAVQRWCCCTRTSTHISYEASEVQLFLHRKKELLWLKGRTKRGIKSPHWPIFSMIDLRAVWRAASEFSMFVFVLVWVAAAVEWHTVVSYGHIYEKFQLHQFLQHLRECGMHAKIWPIMGQTFGFQIIILYEKTNACHACLEYPESLSLDKYCYLAS